jgi:hypothetical protein
MFISIIADLLWLIEVFSNGWSGLGWLSYFHISLLAPPILFFYWIRMLKIVEIEKGSYFKLTILYTIAFITLLSLFVLIFIAGPKAIIIYNENTLWTKKIYLFSVPLVLILTNIIVSKILHRKIYVSDIVYLIFGQIFLIIVSCSICMLLFSINLPYDGTGPNPFWEGLDPVHWFKSGAVIVSFMIYEGLYILKIGKRNPTTASTRQR